MAKLDELFIQFKKDTEVPDLLCDDGELLGADQFFPEDEEGSSGGSGSGAEKSFIPGLGEAVAGIAASAGDRLVAVHRPYPERDEFYYIFRSKDGALSALSATEPQSGFQQLLSEGVAEGASVAPCGEFLAVAAGGRLLFTRCVSGRYCMPEPVPEIPDLNLALTPAVLDGYSLTADTFPQGVIRVDCPADIVEDVKRWLDGTGAVVNPDARSFLNFKEDVADALRNLHAEYVAAAGAAGLYLGSVVCTASLVKGEFTVNSALPMLLRHPDKGLSFRIYSYTITDGEAKITVLINRRPMKLEVPEIRLNADPLIWEGVSLNIGISDVIQEEVIPLVFRGAVSLPSVESDPQRRRGWSAEVRFPSEIDKEERQLLTAEGISGFPADVGVVGVYSFGSRLLSYGADLLGCSAVGYAPAMMSVNRVEGGGITGLAASFRALSSGQFGEIPLYVFTRNGIFAATADGEGGYRSVQQISRDLLREGTLPAIMSNAVAFSSPRGLLLLSGSKVSEPGVAEGYKCCVPVYHYPTDTLLLLDDSGRTFIYNPDSKETVETDFRLTSAAELHPRLWGVIEEGRIHELISVSLSSTDREPESRLQAMESVQPGEVVSRPLKFGNPLVRKKLHSLLLAPDSYGRYPYMKVEGSNDCVNWYFLAESKSGYARLRGSGWRTYRVRLLLGEALPAGMLARLYK